MQKVIGTFSFFKLTIPEIAIYNEATNMYDLDAVTYNIRTYTLNDVKITGSKITLNPIDSSVFTAS